MNNTYLQAGNSSRKSDGFTMLYSIDSVIGIYEYFWVSCNEGAHAQQGSFRYSATLFGSFFTPKFVALDVMRPRLEIKKNRSAPVCWQYAAESC